mmetsp:Transcript_28450/g.60263  ORF Transcript_28450/g.60263 Transcript_28450/m.60263 type:complete len:403 (-) Transcript_28450:129-1337(-)|eukprot:CAMPEP_0172551692 /NCGR_PEP_ID=MMETSP1067-20121228/40144_1 /TAXON_ID=265564 ORGANISM="Thalassiosira punctigera, Strain Tpunct2005C2" /NCGR_SAMPLE_ID=MMETSP1067 /ASSEMBLY_ACC=CAM_ASM_000444 /LENGTH=402 /DNA_ID=CAMNT_0013339503 /DNA_START=107 /DNA_END=1315 /DNA_ORIENTATION=-
MKVAGGAARAISFGVALTCLSLSLTHHSLGIFLAPSDHDDDANDHRAARRRLSSAPPEDDLRAYDYLIIQYHKTGHKLAYSLTKRIRKDVRAAGGDFRVKHDPLARRDHDEMTKCPRVDLQLGTAYVQAAPDFFCDANVLAEELLHGNVEKRGIKIVHLVRNPFKLAVSNYKYHSQSPTPEAWVKGFDVCASEETAGGRHYPDLLMPTLGWNGVMRYEDFDSVLDLCHSLFTTYPGLEEPDFYQHLLKLEPARGLELATSQLIRGKVGDITRMANNIIKFEQLQDLEEQASIAQHQLHHQKKIQVLTLAMEDFAENPKETALRFADFLLGDGTPREVKEGIASKYEEEYLELFKRKDDNNHITTGGSDNSMLEAHLRNHDLYGRILGNIEQVVEFALAESKK